jgi:hypothetical protein
VFWRFPNDGLADVGSDEEVDAGTEAVPFLEKRTTRREATMSWMIGGGRRRRRGLWAGRRDR